MGDLCLVVVSRRTSRVVVSAWDAIRMVTDLLLRLRRLLVVERMVEGVGDSLLGRIIC